MQLIVVAVKYLCHNCNCIMWIFELVAFQKSDFFFPLKVGQVCRIGLYLTLEPVFVCYK